MNDHDIAGRIDRIEVLCEKMALGCELARKQGRMPSLAEAREMDELSLILFQEIRGLPEQACGKIMCPDLRCRATVVMDSARKALESVVQPGKPAHSAPRSAVCRMEAYSTY